MRESKPMCQIGAMQDRWKKKFGCRLGFGLERSMGDGDSLPVSWDGSPLGVKGCPRWTSWDGSERSARFQGLRRGRRPGGNGLPPRKSEQTASVASRGDEAPGSPPSLISATFSSLTPPP